MRVKEQIEETCFVDVCMDFDGVIHSYSRGWEGTDVIPDPPVPGTLAKLYEYLDKGLSVAIHSARSAQPGGIEAMRKWLAKHDGIYRHENFSTEDVSRRKMLLECIQFPICKPAATMYIDDRGYAFNGPGTLPDVSIIKMFVPWNHKVKK